MVFSVLFFHVRLLIRSISFILINVNGCSLSLFLILLLKMVIFFIVNRFLASQKDDINEIEGVFHSNVEK